MYFSNKNILSLTAQFVNGKIDGTTPVPNTVQVKTVFANATSRKVQVSNEGVPIGTHTFSKKTGFVTESV